jgi:hypothetical protein
LENNIAEATALPKASNVKKPAGNRDFLNSEFTIL